MSKNYLDAIAIGGGAAGFFGAIALAEASPNIRVTLIEAGSKPLAKVRISGGGRCNVTHHCFDPVSLVENYPRGGKALRGAFSRFQPQDTVKWFAERGVELKTEADGRMFPVSDSSETIINCLLEAANQAGVRLLTGIGVKSVINHFSDDRPNNFEIELKNGKKLSCDRLLIATGSNPLGYRWAKNLGHKIESPVPSLFTFNIKDSRLEGLAGISVDRVLLRLGTGKHKLEQTGAILITHWGVSGPAILKLSAWGARNLFNNKYRDTLQINWLPEHNLETVKQYLWQLKADISKKRIFSYCPVNLPKRLWQSLVTYVGIKETKIWTELSKQELNKLASELVGGEYQITGKGVFKEEFVTCGGISLKEINFKTMESKKCANLYFAGEILDIDGITGGFNFQSAWTTSWLAAQAMSANK